MTIPRGWRAGPRRWTLRAGSPAFFLRAALAGIVALALVVGWFSYSLPDISTLGSFAKKPSILIKSEDGRIIGSFGDIYGEYIPFNQLPASLVDAVIATEDRNFYHNIGIDPWGLARAALADLRAGHVVQGGSTITQQVAKNVFLTPERSFARKIKEILLALKLERHFSKQDIMSIYLNRVYLGAGNYGVDAAAHRYFGKSVRELTLPESAIIAGMLKAPSRFAPISNPDLSRKRADQVLVNMQHAGYLTARQVARARQDLAQAMSGHQRETQSAFYFADWIADQIPQYIGNVQDDIVVTTTLRPDWQAMAEKAVTEVMDKDGASHHASQAALVAMTPDGAMCAMVGGRSYAKSQYNRATQALRQPGSAFKLFVYLAALEAGFTPDSTVIDQPVSVPIVGGIWEPKNYTHKYLGAIPMKDAVSESVNTVAVQMAVGIGLDRVIEMAQRLGITTPMEAVPSIALGSTNVTLLELTTAYAHLAAGGAIVYPYGILRITNMQGEPIYERTASGAGQVLAPNIVDEMNEMLEGVVEHGTGRAARLDRPAAGKTGTTSDYRDAWFMGYTPQLITGVWVGNDDNTSMKKVTGGMLPAQIWHDFTAQALKGAPVVDIPTSSGFFSPLLPWQTGAHHPPPRQIQQQGQPQSPAPPSPATGGNVILGPDFWNKLMQ
ncbi:MAG: PBP1A family penicillin-binding protein [Pseudomonadota bacterium]|nr:PBP1A family penicillin-binding protein [Pseudomonadota bacterium]